MLDGAKTPSDCTEARWLRVHGRSIQKRACDSSNAQVDMLLITSLFTAAKSSISFALLQYMYASCTESGAPN